MRSPDPISCLADLRGRILTAAEELGYAGPDPSARALARGTTGAVGVLLTDSLRDAFADEVATTFLGAIAEELDPDRARADPAVGHRSGRHDPGTRCADGRRIRLLVQHRFDRGRLAEAAQAAAGVRRPGSVTRIFRASTSTIEPAHVPLPSTSSISAIGASTSSSRTSPGLSASSTIPSLPSDNHVIKQRLLGWFDALQPAGSSRRSCRRATFRPKTPAGAQAKRRRASCSTSPTAPTWAASSTRSFNEAAYNGAEKFKNETGIAYLEFEVTNESPARAGAAPHGRSAAPTIVVAVGFAYATPLETVAERVPGHQVRDHRRGGRPAERAVDRVQGA